LVLGTVSGDFSLADALAIREELAKNHQVDPTYSYVLDFTQCTKLNFSAGDVQLLAQGGNFPAGVRRAAVVPNNFAYGLGRMYEMLRENAGDTGLRVFRSLDEALDWVLSKGTGA
jgi:hypothetical protein